MQNAAHQSSTVSRISAALGYDAAEAALAAGVSLSDVLAMVTSRTVVQADCEPRSATAETVRPQR